MPNKEYDVPITPELYRRFAEEAQVTGKTVEEVASVKIKEAIRFYERVKASSTSK